MDYKEEKQNLFLNIEKLMISNLNRLVGNVYRGQDYSFMLKPSVTHSQIYSYINVLKVLEERDGSSRRRNSGMVRDTLEGNLNVIVKALKGEAYPYKDAKGYFVETIYKSEFSEDFFYSFFLVEYLSREGARYYDNTHKFQDKNMLIDLLTYVDFETLNSVFGTVSCSLEVFSHFDLSEHSVRLKEDVREKVKLLKEGYSENIYSNRKNRYSEWFGTYRNQDDDFTVFVDYAIKNNVSDLQEIYKRVRNVVGSGNMRYASSEMLFAYYSIMGKTSKSALKSEIEKSRSRNDRRECKYSAWIRLGYADKKFMRKMRSETSSDVSLRAAKAIMKYKDEYSNYHDLISQFNDSRFQEVVNYIVNNGDKKVLLGFVGNPLASKEMIFSKINGTEEEGS